jgi:hypothetical protein
MTNNIEVKKYALGRSKTYLVFLLYTQLKRSGFRLLGVVRNIQAYFSSGFPDKAQYLAFY